MCERNFCFSFRLCRIKVGFNLPQSGTRMLKIAEERPWRTRRILWECCLLHDQELHLRCKCAVPLWVSVSLLHHNLCIYAVTNNFVSVGSDFLSNWHAFVGRPRHFYLSENWGLFVEPAWSHLLRRKRKFLLFWFRLRRMGPVIVDLRTTAKTLLPSGSALALKTVAKILRHFANFAASAYISSTSVNFGILLVQECLPSKRIRFMGKGSAAE